MQTFIINEMRDIKKRLLSVENKTEVSQLNRIQSINSYANNHGLIDQNNNIVISKDQREHLFKMFTPEHSNRHVQTSIKDNLNAMLDLMSNNQIDAKLAIQCISMSLVIFYVIYFPRNLRCTTSYGSTRYTLFFS